MQNSHNPKSSQDSRAKDLAKLGYIKFDLETGIAENGKSLCLVSDDEKFIINTLRTVSLPESFELRISSSPIVFTFTK
jgi:hypothetical protein